MIKKYIADFTIVENRLISPRIFMFRLSPTDEKPLPLVLPGQFVEVEVKGVNGLILRRPISVHYVDRANNELWLLIQRAGRGTEALASLTEGEHLNLVYPLGNGFTLPQTLSAKPYLLIGGGVGVAPLLYTGASLVAMGTPVTFLLGGRTATDVAQVALFAQYGEVCLTTEDGSSLPTLSVVKGFVTNHPVMQAGKFAAVRVCGPLPMMKAVARLVDSWEEAQQPHYCEVSLENKMACGLGACLCCVEKTKAGHRCVCTDGPVFDVHDLDW